MTTREQVTILRQRLQVAGQVQGVGFRPFVYRLAQEIHLLGWVINDSRGVTIELQGTAGQLEEFVRRLHAELPPLATISRLDVRDVPPEDDVSELTIKPSEGGELADAQVTVDTAVCDDCLREMNDPADPRYHYPFINCTNCGPRYTIVRRIPYDRPNTTMAGFEMCPLCSREYHDPACRRFHAQPIACPVCGPKVWLTDARGVRVECEDVIARAAELLLDGKVLAIKGLGGFHLACRADEDHVVRTLRRRKRRDAKPFAVMVADLDHVKDYCTVPVQAERLLTGITRPIVLLPMLEPTSIAPSVADGLGTLGIMLPYTPLHHLLFDQPGMRAVPLVMTSGNFSDEPLVKDNDAAIAHLGQIADFLLMHDRPIERRVDDSVVQMHIDGTGMLLRRGRGYAPKPVELSVASDPAAPSAASEPVKGATAKPSFGAAVLVTKNQTSRPAAVLGVGPELKNTVCLYRGGKAVVSEHIGDLKDGRVYRHFIDTINHLQDLFDVEPTVLAADLHPQYLSTQYAMRRHRGELEGLAGLPIIRVQHHHAHIAACMAEHGRTDAVIGLACDGVGLGDDNAVWGCEVMLADLRSYRRLGHLRYVPLPGGDAAAKETARPALAAMWDTFGPAIIEMPVARHLAGGEGPLERAIEMLSTGLNCPPSSSLGRWFDAVAALLAVATTNGFEGQAPMRLEGAIVAGVENAYTFKLISPPQQGTIVLGRGTLSPSEPPFLIDLRPMVEEIVNELSAGYNAGIIAARFHNTVAAFLLASAVKARELTGLRTVALSGGCFANRYLTHRLGGMLVGEGFEVLHHVNMPCNDGCVSLGQAMIAANQ